MQYGSFGHWQLTVEQVMSFWSRNEELCATISNTPSIVSRPTEYGPLIEHEGVLLSRRAGAVAHMNRVANGRLVAFPACFTRTEGTRPNTACDTAPAARASTTRSTTRGSGIDSALVRRLAGEAIDAGELTGDLAKDKAVFTARAAQHNLGAHAGGSGPPPPPADVADRIVEHLVLGARARAFSAPIAAAMDLLIAGEPLEKAVEAALPAAASASASRGAAGEVVAGEAVAAAVVVAVAAAGAVVAAGAAGLMAAVAASGMLAVVRLVAEAQVMAAARALTGTGVVAVAVVAAAAGVITAARLVAVVAAAGVMAVAGAVAVVGGMEALQRHRWKAAERCEVVRDLFMRLVFLLCGCGELPADLRWRVACAWHEGLEVGPKALRGMRALLGRRHQVAAACLFYESAIYDRRRQQQAAGAAASSSSSSSSQQERASAIASISVTSALRFMGDSLPVPSAPFSWEWGGGGLSLVQKVAREQYGPLLERLARVLVSPAVGPYCLLSNNCLDFADYVATGSMHRREARKRTGMAMAAAGAAGATAAALAGPLMFAVAAAAAVAACGVAAAPGVGRAGGQGGGGAPANANSGAATGNNNADGDVAAARMLTYLEAACELYVDTGCRRACW